MRWTCPKCGKKLDISNEQLIANDGVIICPQCLLQARQPVPNARVAARYDKADADAIASSSTPPPPKRAKTTSTPPPPKTRMKQASTSYRYTGLSGNGDTKKKPKKKSKKKKNQQGMSALGCLGRTIIFTLVLCAAYVFFGLLLEALQ